MRKRITLLVTALVMAFDNVLRRSGIRQDYLCEPWRPRTARPVPGTAMKHAAAKSRASDSLLCRRIVCHVTNVANLVAL